MSATASIPIIRPDDYSAPAHPGDLLSRRQRLVYVLVLGALTALGPFTVDPTLAVDSLAALAGLTPHWVLPGHGDAWTGGLPEAIERIRAAAGRSG